MDFMWKNKNFAKRDLQRAIKWLKGSYVRPSGYFGTQIAKSHYVELYSSWLINVSYKNS